MFNILVYNTMPQHVSSYSKYHEMYFAIHPVSGDDTVSVVYFCPMLMITQKIHLYVDLHHSDNSTKYLWNVTIAGLGRIPQTLLLCAHFVILLSILTLCRSLKVELIGVQGRNYGLVVTDLCGKIVADQSFVKVHVFQMICVFSTVIQVIKTMYMCVVVLLKIFLRNCPFVT